MSDPSMPQKSPVAARQGLVARIQAILLKPAETWDLIAAEADSIPAIFTGYVVPLAVVAPVCGVLAAEYLTLPKPMRTAVIRFFDDNQKWLANVLTQGQADKTLTFTGPPEDVAQSILSTLEGAMLVARPYGDVSRFNTATRRLLAGLTA